MDIKFIKYEPRAVSALDLGSARKNMFRIFNMEKQYSCSRFRGCENYTSTIRRYLPYLPWIIQNTACSVMDTEAWVLTGPDWTDLLHSPSFHILLSKVLTPHSYPAQARWARAETCVVTTLPRPELCNVTCILHDFTGYRNLIFLVRELLEFPSITLQWRTLQHWHALALLPYVPQSTIEGDTKISFCILFQSKLAFFVTTLSLFSFEKCTRQFVTLLRTHCCVYTALLF